jgi:hypothetical protein
MICIPITQGDLTYVDEPGIVTLTTTSGFHALIKYDLSGDFWIKDILADEWYFSSFKEGGRFSALLRERRAASFGKVSR